MANEHKNRLAFTPVPNCPYVMANSLQSVVACVASFADNSAIMVNMKSGWQCMAHGIGMYDDGTIDWDYSTGGRFVEIPYHIEPLKEERA